jgi:hypothetical protein
MEMGDIDILVTKRRRIPKATPWIANLQLDILR